jgi:hypothetical protein
MDVALYEVPVVGDEQLLDVVGVAKQVGLERPA